jgi:hypothetical protein
MEIPVLHSRIPGSSLRTDRPRDAISWDLWPASPWGLGSLGRFLSSLQELVSDARRTEPQLSMTTSGAIAAPRNQREILRRPSPKSNHFQSGMAVAFAIAA